MIEGRLTGYRTGAIQLYEEARTLTLNRKNINVGQASPPAAIPVAAPRASKRPTTRNGVFGIDNISSVTIPTRYRICKIEKYTITYLKERKHTRVSHINYSKHNPKMGGWGTLIHRLHFMLFIRVKNAINYFPNISRIAWFKVISK